MSVLIDPLVTVATSLIVRLAEWVFVRRRKRLIRSAEHQTPLIVHLTRIDREDWTLALASPISPEDASSLDGFAVPMAFEWLRQRGAIDFRETMVKLSLRGCVGSGCTVTNMRVERTCLPALAGARVHSPPAGAAAAILLRFELDSPTPVAWEWCEDGGRARNGSLPYFLTHSIRVGMDEVVDVLVWGDATSHLVEWALILDVEVNGELVEVRVDNAGEPFLTSGQPDGGFAQDLVWAWFEGGQLLHATPTGMPGPPVAHPPIQ